MAQILVIDDQDVFRRMLNRMLTKAGYDVIEASNGTEGLKLYQLNQIDLVITDIFMPEKEGVETAIELKKINPEIKIIAVSGGAFDGKFNFLNQMEDVWAQKTFKKPFVTEEFLGAVEELLEN